MKGKNGKEKKRNATNLYAARLVQVVEHHNALPEVEVFVLPLL